MNNCCLHFGDKHALQNMTESFRNLFSNLLLLMLNFCFSCPRLS